MRLRMSNKVRRRSPKRRSQGGLSRREFFKGSAQATLAIGGLVLASSGLNLLVGHGHDVNAADEVEQIAQASQYGQEYGTRASPAIPLLLLDD